MANGPISYAVGPQVVSDQVTVAIPAGTTIGIDTNTASGDAFGRLRTSGTGNRWDCEFLYDKQPLLVDEVLAGAGTATYDPVARDIVLAVVDTGATSAAALYSHYDVPYTPGNSHLPEVTGTLDGFGLGGGVASVFLRTTITGGTTTQEILQDDWDPAASTGIDWSKSQIFAVDFQSLRVGRIRYTLNRGGATRILATLANDNIRATGYWQTPTLPVYHRIYNDGADTVAEMGYGDLQNAIGIRYRRPIAAVARMRAICSTVKSEGGVGLFDMPGFPFAADNSTTPKTVAATLIPVLSIRVKDVINGIANRGLYIPESYSIQANHPIYYQLIYRPTLTGASWVDVNATYSGMQRDVSATAVTGGIVVYSNYFGAGTGSGGSSRPTSAGGVLGRTIMSLGRSGTADILTLAAVRTDGSSPNVFSVIRWREIR